MQFRTMQTKNLFNLAVVFAALVSGNNAYACAACGCTLSTDWGNQGAGQEISTKQGFSTDLSYSYVNQNRMIYGSGKASGAQINSLYANGQEIETLTQTQIVTASLNYTGENGGFMLQMPYLYRTHSTDGVINSPNAPLGSNYTTSSDRGMGDVRIIGSYTGLSSDKTSGIIIGIKLPTGSTGTNFNGGVGAGSALDSGLQLGTGSTDLILGGFSSGLVSTYGWFVQGTMQHAVATEPALGNLTYRPGDAYGLNTGIRSAAFGSKISPMLQLNVIKRQADSGTSVPTDVFSGIPVSGGTLAYLAPGVSVRAGHGMSVYGFVQIPVYQNVNSLQLVPQYTVTIGLRQALD